MSKGILVVPKHYGVSPCGVVYSRDHEQTIRNRWGSFTKRTRKGKALKPFLDSKGKYLYVALGKYKKVSVHRLVATTYIPNPNNLPCVNHKDGNPKNNRVNNLEWVDNFGNMQHAACGGRIKGFYGKQKLIPSTYTDRILLEKYRETGSINGMDGFWGCCRTTIGRYMNKRGLL